MLRIAVRRLTRDVSFPAVEDALVARLRRSHLLQRYAKERPQLGRCLVPVLQDAQLAVVAANRTHAALRWGYRAVGDDEVCLESVLLVVLLCCHVHWATVDQRVCVVDSARLVAEHGGDNTATHVAAAQRILFWYRYGRYVDSNAVVLHVRDSPAVPVLAAAVRAAEPSPHLVSLLASITAGSVEEACELLTGLAPIPACVAVDLLRRDPASPGDLTLQHQMFDMCVDAMPPAVGQSVVKALVHNTLAIAPAMAAGIASRYLQAHPTTPKAFTSALAFLAAQRAPRYHAGFTQGLLALQKVLARGTPDELVVLGVRTAVRSHLYVAEPSQFPLHQHTTAIATAQLLDGLSSAFRSATHALDNRFHKHPLVWAAFVDRLHLLHELTPARTAQIIRQALAYQMELPLRTLTQLMVGITRFEDFEDVLAEVGYLPRQLLPVFLGRLRRYGRYARAHEPFRNHTSILAYARAVYLQVERPLVALLGALLKWEAQADPQHVQQVYTAQLQRTESPIPDRRCLLALISAAMASVLHKSRHVKRLASLGLVQFAVQEFNRWVQPRVASTAAEARLVFPDYRLWDAYVELCLIHRFTEQTVYTLSHWERLEYTPTSRTLTKVLASMEPAQSSQLIVTATKQRGESEPHTADRQGRLVAGVYAAAHWPWPLEEAVSTVRRRLHRKLDRRQS